MDQNETKKSQQHFCKYQPLSWSEFHLCQGDIKFMAVCLFVCYQD